MYPPDQFSLKILSKYDIDKIENKSNSDKTTGEIRCFFDERKDICKKIALYVYKTYNY